MKRFVKGVISIMLIVGVCLPISIKDKEVKAATNERAAIVKNAESYLGVKYLYSGTNPATGLDCSALTQLVYRNVLKIDIGRTTWDQKANRLAISGRLYDLVNAKPGDLYFWEGRDDHVGLATGNGNFIHSSPTKDVSRQNIYNYPPSYYIRMNLSETFQPSKPSKFKSGDIVKLNANATITAPEGNNEAIPSGFKDQYYVVERVLPLAKKWNNSEYQVLVSSSGNTFRKFVYEEHLTMAPPAKFEIGAEVRLRGEATLASIHWGRRVLEQKFLREDYTIQAVATTADGKSAYQYMINNPILGNLWVLEQDLLNNLVWFVTSDPFMDQRLNQVSEIKDGSKYKIEIKNVSDEKKAIDMVNKIRTNTWGTLLNGNVFLIEYPDRILMKVVGVPKADTAWIQSECLRLTRGQIPTYNEKNMKLVSQNSEYDWVEIDNLPKDWQAISNRLRNNLREKFNPIFLRNRVSYEQQSDGKYTVKVINLENNVRANDIAKTIQGMKTVDVPEYGNTNVLNQK